MFIQSDNSTLAHRLAICIWLVCVVFSSVSIFAAGYNGVSDLVYCPLQRQWVKKNVDQPPVSPLGNFCSSNKNKAAFLRSLLQTAGSVRTNADGGEHLFFNFVQKGERSFAELPLLPDAPEQELAALGRHELTVNGSRTAIIVANDAVISLEELSRPPIRDIAVNFPSARLHILDPISRSASPRGPPIS